jgi:uncharacterized protein (TIGR02996 family)
MGAVAWEELVHAIRLDPESDAPRLVCADWLQDRGDPRGEYIALACRLAQLPRGSPQWIDAMVRRSEIAREAEWARPCANLGAKWTMFHRGFLERVVLEGRHAASLPALCRLEPIVDVVLVSSGPRWFAAVAEMPELAQLRSLEITGQHLAGCETLLASPAIARVRVLRGPKILRGALPHRPWDGVDRGIADALRRHDELEDLYLLHADDAAIHALIARPFARLRRLTLRECAVTARAFEALGARLDRLEHLGFNRTPLTPEIAAVLVNAMRGGKLRSLQLDCGETDGLNAFIASPAFRGVEQLNLEDFVAFDPRALERSPYRGQLRKLTYGWGKRNDIRLDLPGVELVNLDEGW